MLAFFSGLKLTLLASAVSLAVGAAGAYWFRDKLCDATAAQAELTRHKALVDLMAARIETMQSAAQVSAAQAEVDKKRMDFLQSVVDAIPVNGKPCLDEKAVERLRSIR